MPDESMVGQQLDRFPLPVESSKVREFARALRDDDPIYQDDAAARAAGFEGIPAPVTFAAASSHYRDDLPLFEQLGLDLKRLLHGESSWEYLAPVRVGDQLTARRRLADVSTRPGKRGGDMTLCTLETEYVNQHGTSVIRERTVVTETGGAQ
jgi:acyl dehydratase